ncbi:hypothetical protein GIV52_09225 [Pseudomonas syringae]|nr:hypothetical protein [Pseudomonas syringae]MCF5481896.1 hypothetical protein [Pseudomonas syringae]MCF5486946.1 hypothetical protein [Pseudomonas syringae]MCF5495842.1 hypothetical protein [Pseudomonas syringae]MCF5524273.1 hypothetical protein [Pseudomonas syringae]
MLAKKATMLPRRGWWSVCGCGSRFCTKSRRAKVRQGKNRRGSGVYVL